MVLFKSLHHRWIYISEEKAVMIAVRFYELSHGKENIVAINRLLKVYHSRKNNYTNYATAERIDKMTINELLKAKDRNEQIIADYLRRYSENNHWGQIEATQRTLSECMSKIRELARKKAVGGCACIVDTEVFQWAVDFYNGVEPRVEPLAEESVKAEKPKPKKTVEKKVENDEQQMSLFDFM